LASHFGGVSARVLPNRQRQDALAQLALRASGGGPSPANIQQTMALEALARQQAQMSAASQGAGNQLAGMGLLGSQFSGNAQGMLGGVAQGRAAEQSQARGALFQQQSQANERNFMLAQAEHQRRQQAIAAQMAKRAAFLGSLGPIGGVISAADRAGYTPEGF